MRILGVESSCDDSSIAIIDSTSGIEFYWVDSHKEPKKFGGVIPELASRTHQLAFKKFFTEIALKNFKTLDKIEAIAYTAGPGLFGSLWVGASVAQALALSYKLPIFPVNHLYGHIFSPFIGQKLETISFPFLSLLVSGGHTQIWHVQNVNQLTLLGTTRDDAAGEALDKVARFMGLGYPGGPKISNCTINHLDSKFIFPIANLGSKNFDFSFSGLKSAFFRKASTFSASTLLEERNELLAGFEIAIVKNLIKQLEKAVSLKKIKHISLSGGVSANLRLRAEVETLSKKYKCTVHLPILKYTGDNAAMIAYYALLQVQSGEKGLDAFKTPLNLFTRM